ncbi:hypothetical protein K493DRAFT_382237 [Basidiobolus meristosporus CBS 931.73]|uniref:Uncharacterized protein n=1 Tax=Basidiobolus meristosporus CBS 931.73 TaxID=1314790 RepID=A0A1Y1XVM6_9FUNG|nr:hypothetical protein K493DRAFT_382237 [Basidiobolus meristosporus CBS 931.73]|eukprot:ORX89725.1 hypothetical protein K493DRAFT_382237 [Basidiobolus meristosporus CBS 931.73]
MKNRRRVQSSPRYAPFLSLTRKGSPSSAPSLTHNIDPTSHPPTHHSCHTISPSGDSPINSLEAGPDMEIPTTPMDDCRLRIDNTYLLEQNRALSQELAQAKLTAHALRQIIVRKDSEVTKLRQENRRLILKQSSFGSELASELTLTRSTQPQSKFLKEEDVASKETTYS